MCTPLKSLSSKFFRRETGKNIKPHRIANPKTLFEFCRKPETQSEIEQKPQKTSKPKNQTFLFQKQSKNCQINCKTENPNAYLLKVYVHEECFEPFWEVRTRVHMGSIKCRTKTSILISFNSSYFGSLQLAFVTW